MFQRLVFLVYVTVRNKFLYWYNENNSKMALAQRSYFRYQSYQIYTNLFYYFIIFYLLTIYFNPSTMQMMTPMMSVQIAFLCRLRVLLLFPDLSADVGRQICEKEQ